MYLKGGSILLISYYFLIYMNTGDFVKCDAANNNDNLSNNSGNIVANSSYSWGPLGSFNGRQKRDVINDIFAYFSDDDYYGALDFKDRIKAKNQAKESEKLLICSKCTVSVGRQESDDANQITAEGVTVATDAGGTNE